MDTQKLRNRPCYKSDKDEYGMIEVKTCMDGTEDVCCLSEGETGIQRTGVTNWRSHVSTVEIQIRSLNQNITLMSERGDGEKSYEYVEEAHIPPSKGNNVDEYEFKIFAERESDGTSTSGIIQLSMTVDTEQAAESRREGPTLHSKIQFE